MRADAGRLLDQAHAEATREREELRADLRARAEQQADAYHDELTRLRAASPDTETPAKPGRRGTRA